MLNFILQTLDWFRHSQFHYFIVFFICAWALWLSRVLAALFYRPFRQSFSSTVSVIIPVVDEPEEFFREVLKRIAENNPTEIIVVVNGPRNETLEKVCAEFGLVKWFWTPIAGKRNGIREGVENSRGEILVMVDSDTLWKSDTLTELLKPFADSRVGGVTTNQKIWRPERSVWTRFADWLEDFRFAYGLPASSILGQVGCLPGRTIAFRRKIIVDALPQLMSEVFLGIHLEVSDDRSMTNYALLAGYRTVYQRTSIVHTDAPVQSGKFVRQHYRWARGSQYNSLKMFPWMIANGWFLTLVSISDIILPFFLAGVYFNFAFKVFTHHGVVSAGLPILHYMLLATLGGSIGLMIKQPQRLLLRPSDLLLLPVYWLIISFILAPVRIWGFARMAYDEPWGTRENSYTGGAKSELRWVPMLLAILILAFFMALGPILER